MGQKIKHLLFLIFIISGFNGLSQISELSVAEDLAINEKKEFNSLEDFGQQFVQMLNEKDTLLILELLASEKLIKKSIRSNNLDKDTKKTLKGELKGDFNKRVVAENLKLLSKLFQNLDNQNLEFVELKLNAKTKTSDFKIGNAVIWVTQGSETYTINIGRILLTNVGWRALQITDYFAQIKPVDAAMEQE